MSDVRADVSNVWAAAARCLALCLPALALWLPAMFPFRVLRAFCLLLLIIGAADARRRFKKADTSKPGRRRAAGSYEQPLREMATLLSLDEVKLLSSPAAASKMLAAVDGASVASEVGPVAARLLDGARGANKLELAMEAARLLGSIESPDAHMQAAMAYQALCPLMAGEGLLGASSRCQWLSLDQIEQLAPVPPPARRAKAAILAQSSHLDGHVLTLARSFHKEPAGSKFWRRLKRNLEAHCPSLDATSTVALFEGEAVLSRPRLLAMVEGCLRDSEMVRQAISTGGSLVATNTQVQ